MKPVYPYVYRGLITFLPLTLTVYVLVLFASWTERTAMSVIRPLVGDFYLPGRGIVLGAALIAFRSSNRSGTRAAKAPGPDHHPG